MTGGGRGLLSWRYFATTPQSEASGPFDFSTVIEPQLGKIHRQPDCRTRDLNHPTMLSDNSVL
eukprot:2407-Eustigmatos_ZCMA.PRE.1